MDKARPIVKWMARILGGLAILYFLTLFANKEAPSKGSSALMLLLFAGFSYLFAWFREKESGIALVFAGIVLGLKIYYDRELGDTEAFLFYSLPFLIPGLMFWWVGNKKAVKH